MFIKKYRKNIRRVYVEYTSFGRNGDKQGTLEYIENTFTQNSSHDNHIIFTEAQLRISEYIVRLKSNY